MLRSFNNNFLSYGGRFLDFTQQNNPLWDNLLSYYTADNTPNDAIGGNNGLLYNGATYDAGIINQGFSLDGVNDYVAMGDVLDFDGSTPFSISAWIYPTLLTSFRIIASKLNNGTPFEGYSMQLNDGKLRFFLCSNYSTNKYIDVNSVDLVLVNTWSFINITYDGSKNVSGIRMYINGTNKTFTTANNTLTGSTSNVRSFSIGSNNGAAGFFKGKIDEVGVWGRELTPTEVTELYNSGAGKQYPN